MRVPSWFGGIAGRALRGSTVLALALGGVSAPLAAATGQPAPGVQLKVLGGHCSQTQSMGADPDDTLVELVLHVEARNPTQEPMSVHRDQLVVMTADGAALQPQNWNSAKPIALNPNQPTTFELRYMETGAACAGGMTLETAGGVQTVNGPVAVPPVKLVPRGQAPG